MKALGDAIGRDGKTLAQGQQSWSGWIRMGSAVPLA